jgi:thiamine monophosphate synthase
MFATTTKKVQSTHGPALLDEILPAVEIPVFAIGGIDLENVKQLADVGCRHVAVSSAIWDAPDPIAAYKALEEALGT